jgi:cysteine-rich repeat protein
MRTQIALLGLLFAACTSSGAGDDHADDAPATCGNGAVDPGETCDDGNTDDFDGCLATCEQVDPIVADPGVWTYIEVPDTACIDGTTAGFSINPGTDPSHVLIYLEGGGACFNTYCDSLFTWSGNTPTAGGVFDRGNTANPVADWTMIYVPYCSGDIFAGDSEAMVGGSMRTFHGYSNFTKFLERWVPSFTDAQQVVLSGSSAGGFGAFSNFPQTQDAFKDIPVTLIDDSGPPLSSDVFPPCLQTIFRDTWGLDKTLAGECGDDCADTSDYVRDFLDHVRAKYPNLSAGIFSSMGDTTIRLFAGYGWYGGYNMCAEVPQQVSATVYGQGLLDLRAHIGGGGDVGMYLTAGQNHTILRSTGFYDGSLGTMSPAEWLAQTIGGAPADVGPPD